MSSKVTIGLVLVAATAAAAPSPVARSAPRADWPCRLDVVATDAVTWAFEYAGPKACTFPIELHADGIVGCPTAIAISNPAVHYSGRLTIAYDKTGHMISYQQTESVERKYVWEGDRLLGEKGEPYTIGDHVKKLFEDKPMLDITPDKQNRAVAVDYISDGEVTGRAKITWRDSRLASIETRSLVDRSITKITAVYDCKR